MRGPACSVCSSPACQAADEALATGTTLIAAAAAHGFSKSALGRHRTNCLAPKLTAAAAMVAPSAKAREGVERARAISAGALTPSVADIATLEGIVGAMARSLNRLEAAAESAANGAAYNSLAAVSGQLHKAVEVVARIQGLGRVETPDAPKFTVNIVMPTEALPPRAALNRAGTKPAADYPSISFPWSLEA